MKHINKIIISTTLLISTNSSSAVYGGSNLGWSGYPDHSCSEPFYMSAKPSFTTQDEVDDWNYQVRDYNSQMEGFRTCINEYIEDGNNDMKRIKEGQEDAISDWDRRS